MNKKNQTSGCIEVICGPMFSGKTEELIRRLKRSIIAKNKILVFKPEIDNRYSDNLIVSHNKNSIKSITIKDEKKILEYKDEKPVGKFDYKYDKWIVYPWERMDSKEIQDYLKQEEV